MAIQKSGKGTATKADEIKYEVLEECGTISVNKTKAGENYLKLRYMSWNGREPKYDIRPWYTDEEGNERCLKPRGYTGEELLALRDLINKLEEE